MDYIWGVLAGLAFGGLAGIIKYFALWHRTLNAPEDRGIKPSSVYTKMIISNVVNVAVLAVVFILRKHLPLILQRRCWELPWDFLLQASLPR